MTDLQSQGSASDKPEVGKLWQGLQFAQQLKRAVGNYLCE